MVLLHDENLLAKQMQRLSRSHFKSFDWRMVLLNDENLLAKTSAKTFKTSFKTSTAVWFYYTRRIYKQNKCKDFQDLI
jgi:hypothetical protein